MKATVNDIYGTEVTLQNSRSGYIRFDFKNEESFPERKHERTGETVPNCLSFNFREAKVLHATLSALLEDDEN